MAQSAALVRAPGAEVGLLLRNRPSSVGLLLGVLAAGGCVVTINPGRGRDRTREDIAALDLPVLAGEPADLAELVPDGLRAATAAVAAVGQPFVVSGPVHRCARERPSAPESPCACSPAARRGRPSGWT